MCVVAGWPRARHREERFRLIWKQALHWATFLVAMLVVTSSEVRGVENNNSMGLNLMTILASGLSWPVYMPKRGRSALSEPCWR